MVPRCCDWFTVPAAAVLLAGAGAAQSSQLLTEQLLPTIRLPVMSYDEARARLLFVLENGSIWEWDGSGWARSLAVVPGWCRHAAFDPARQHTMLVATTRAG